MNRNHIRINVFALAVVVLFAGATAACGGDVTREGIGGAYRCEGANPDGSQYQGTVNITEAGGTYQVDWNVSGSSYSGTGTLNGTTFTVDWGEEHPAIYELQPDGKLVGTWANGAGSETMYPI